MSLVNASVFHQKPQGVTWTAPIGTLTDGASIPPIFWDVIGGPFEGKYRDAAVNHDYECCKKIHPWRDAHRMFYAGMMANGEAMWRAKLMYFAVYFFGPRWSTEALLPRPRFTEGDIARAAHVFKNDPTITLENIEALSSPKLRAKKGLVPRSVKGWQLLDDEKIVKPVKREGPCIE